MIFKLIGTKQGITHVFLNGVACVSTILKICPCFIIHIKLKEHDGYNALQLGYNPCRSTGLKKSSLGYFKNYNSVIFRNLIEISINNPFQFRIGQYFDVTNLNGFRSVSIKSKTLGKGFCGVIKKHNFVTGPMTHGSKNHRQPGSIGQGTSPGRVFKGKKLAGKMGNNLTTFRNLKLLQINYLENYIVIKGICSGAINSEVTIIFD